MVTATHRKRTQSGVTDAQDYLDAIKEKLATDRATKRLWHKHPLDDTEAVIFGDGAKRVLVRRPTNEEHCVIDWLNVTLSATELKADIKDFKHGSDVFEQNQVMKFLSQKLLNAIGFGIDTENPSGRNFYKRSFNLEHGAGFVCIGGQRDTVLITINGTGCNYALLHWENYLFTWLARYETVNITRIDLAHDILTRSYLTIDLFNEIHAKGGFSKGGRPPEIEHRGNWKRPNGKGRTLYIGSRQSDKFCRIYEKGKQLGDSESPWLRVEVEYKSNNAYIPLNILLNPTDYFIATYPCFYLLEQHNQEKRFDVREKEELLTFEQAINIVKRQYGRYLHLFRQCFCDDKQMLDVLTDIPNKTLPERLNYLSIPKTLSPKQEVLDLINQAQKGVTDGV